MNKLEPKFKIGDVVTFRNHPLLYDHEVKGDSKYVPPLMIIKEIILENYQKKTHEDITGKKIAERIKYICVFFDDNKSEFIESHLYESTLDSIHNLHVGEIDEEEFSEVSKAVRDVLDYPSSPEYEYGKIIYFKTKKLEVLKRKSAKVFSTLHDYNKPDKKTKRKSIQYLVNYATPEFIISGFKKESYTDLYFKDGKLKRIASTELVKVQWYNPIGQKFSEIYLPIECFTDKTPFQPRLPHNKAHKHMPEPAVHFDNIPPLTEAKPELEP